MKRTIGWTAFALCLAAQVGCVTTRAEGNALRSDMRMLKDEMARINRVQMDDKALVVEKLGDVSERLERTENSLRSLRQQNADHGLKTEKIIAELQAVRGEVEEVRHELGKTSKSVEDLLVRPPVSVATAVDAPPVPEASNAKPKVDWPTNEKDLFALAGKSFETGDYPASLDAVNVYLKRFKSSKAVALDDVYFLKGEAFSALANKAPKGKGKEDALRKAVLAYQNVLTGFPKSKHAPAVLYKIGQAFESLGFKKDAAVFYEEVVAKHKKSAFVPKARSRIKAIKKGRKSKKK